MTLFLAGIHHVSALSAHIERTHAFYTQVLGLRPLITTVNQDDPRMYHLFFGDGVDSPGSDMTVFDLPHAVSERRGNTSISRTIFRVHGAPALAYWTARLEQHGVAHAGIVLRDGRHVLDFDDPEGTQLGLIDDGGAGEAFPWDASPVPAEHQIHGLGYPVITVPVHEPTARFHIKALGLRHDHTFALAEALPYQVHVYMINNGGASAEVHLVARDDLLRAKYGAGGGASRRAARPRRPADRRLGHASRYARVPQQRGRRPALLHLDPCTRAERGAI